MNSKLGQIIIFTGEGKGKTSAALGTVIRALGNGWNVGWVSLYKETSWKLSEVAFFDTISDVLKGRLEFELAGKGFFLQNALATSSESVKTAPVNDQIVIDDDSPDVHKKAANLALDRVHDMLKMSQKQLVVIDEVCNALYDGLIELKQLTAILADRGETHIVLTGRNCPQELIEMADLVTEMKKIKHPFDSEKNAIKGLDF